MRRFLAGLGLFGAMCLMGFSSQARPLRIVSTNMCADQFLIPLADKEQIAALSHYARDPVMSFYAREAQSYPVDTGSVEEILALKPDLVIASSVRKQNALAQLKERGVAILEIKPAENYAAIVTQARQIAAAVGYPERGDALVAEMNRKLAAIPKPDSTHGEAAYYQRRGYLDGAGTLIDDIMHRAGFTNLAGRLGRKFTGRLSLESIVQARPDYLIVDTEADPAVDNGSAMLFHPALDRIIPPERRLSLPQAMTDCGGPGFPDAVSLLVNQLKRQSEAARP